MGRDRYQFELDRLTGLLVSMARAARQAIAEASDALLTADRDRAEAVLAGDAEINRLRWEVDDAVVGLLARQQPVAVDLRLVVSAPRTAADLERMGDLAKHVAKIVLLRHPVVAVPQPLAPLFAEMAEAAIRIAAKAETVLVIRDPVDAAQTGLDDDEMDELNRRLFAELTDRWPYGVEAAVDAALLSRFYERFADHAVTVGRQVVYLVTGDVHLGRP